MSKKLIFVYNANSGLTSAVFDLAHKTIRPKSYPCKLCAVTYSGVLMRKTWKQYVADLGMPAVFLHRDQFAKAYPKQNITFPSVLLGENQSLKVVIGSNEFDHITDLSDFMSLLSKKLH